MEYNKKNILIIILVVFIVLIIWGIIGGVQADSIGITCDVGLTDNLCWKWHTNAIGHIGDAVNDIFN